jgi:hypothetical protein
MLYFFFQIAENKRVRLAEEAEKVRKREEKNQKKEDDLKVAENPTDENKKPKEDELIKMTDRQREALTAQKEKEEKDRQRKEDLKKSEAQAVERNLIDQVVELQAQIGPLLLGKTNFLFFLKPYFQVFKSVESFKLI